MSPVLAASPALRGDGAPLAAQAGSDRQPPPSAQRTRLLLTTGTGFHLGSVPLPSQNPTAPARSRSTR